MKGRFDMAARLKVPAASLPDFPPAKPVNMENPEIETGCAGLPIVTAYDTRVDRRYALEWFADRAAAEEWIVKKFGPPRPTNLRYNYGDTRRATFKIHDRNQRRRSA
jgi:hypothetical protein